MIVIDEEPRLRNKYKLCRACNSKKVDVFSIPIRLAVRENRDWIPVKYLLPKVKCRECGAEGEAIEGHKFVHDATCVSRRLPTPAEIRDICRVHRINVIQLAKLLGVGKELVKMWESRRRFPTRAESLLVKLIGEEGPEALEDFKSGPSTPADVRDICKRRNLNIVQLAKLLGVDKELAKKWESGDEHPALAEELLLKYIQENGPGAIGNIHSRRANHVYAPRSGRMSEGSRRADGKPASHRSSRRSIAGQVDGLQLV